MQCPYCGVSSGVAHETQEACIEALHAEITRVRELLRHVRSVSVPGRAERDIDMKEDTDRTTGSPTKL